jgi:adenosylcobinamide-phosphate synthase
MSGAFEPSLVVLAAALLIDAVMGEYPNAIHPVAWMGRSITALERLAPTHGQRKQLVFGAFVAVFIPSAFATMSWAVVSGLKSWPLLNVVVAILLLKSTFAIHGLASAAAAVREAVTRGSLGDARSRLRALCGRDASQLDEPLLVAATVESLAENASDSYVAPLFYYLLFGLPGAVFYRAVNTLDAMIGYRGRYEYLGKASARLDDLLNLVPARLTAGLMLLAGWVCRADARSGWAMFQRDRGRTASPNAGQTMAAMAGLLRVRLEKVGHYQLGDPLEALTAGKIDAARRIVLLGATIAGALCLTALWIRDIHAS